jgi:uncharacterized protein
MTSNLFQDDMTPSKIFICQKCGECCKGYGGTFVTQKDLEAISQYTKIPLTQLLEKYCQLSGKKPVLAQGKDGYCIFRKEDLCGIHPVKPRMCKAWPFIESVVKNPENWHMMAGCCPGMRTDVSDDTIRECVSAVLADEKAGKGN